MDEQMIELIARAICAVNEPDPDEHMLPGTPCWVALIPEARAAHSVIAGKVAELEGAGRLALKVAESWIHDQLDGTSMLNDALADLDPARAALAPHPKGME